MAATGLTWMLILCEYDLQCIPYRLTTWYALMRGCLTKAQHEMKRALLLDVVVAEGATIFELFACEDKALLVRGNTFLVLDLLLYVLDRVRGFNVKSDCFTGECLYEDLHVYNITQYFFLYGFRE